MDIFDIHNVKVEKANAMLRYRRFRKIANLFRLIELFLAVILSAWISTRLPSVIGMLSIYLRHALTIVVSPLFIFLISNVIVITLVVISGQLNGNGNGSGSGNGVSNVVTDLYDEIVSDDVIDDLVNIPPVIEPEEKIVYQDKQIVSEVKPSHDRNVYKRSQSENLKKNDNGKLKRSETELGRRKSETPVTENVVDELSDKEFQKRIEGFIAKQVKFHQREKLAIVVNPHNNNEIAAV